jgi:hypothetical protein
MSLPLPPGVHNVNAYLVVKDPDGNSWWIATHIEDVAPDELARRHEAEHKRRSGGAAG